MGRELAILCSFLLPAGCEAPTWQPSPSPLGKATDWGWQSHRQKQPGSLTPWSTTQALGHLWTPFAEKRTPCLSYLSHFYVWDFVSLKNNINPRWIKRSIDSLNQNGFQRLWIKLCHLFSSSENYGHDTTYALFPSSSATFDLISCSPSQYITLYLVLPPSPATCCSSHLHCLPSSLCSI